MKNQFAVFSLDSKLQKYGKKIYEIYLNEISSRHNSTKDWYIGEGAYKYEDGEYLFETCALLSLSTEQLLEDVIELATAYRQETILIIDSQSEVFLYNLATKNKTHIGIFTEVNHLEAKNDPYGYTKIKDIYFIVKKHDTNSINSEVQNDVNTNKSTISNK
jgi:hypothetical protein